MSDIRGEQCNMNPFGASGEIVLHQCRLTLVASAVRDSLRRHPVAQLPSNSDPMASAKHHAFAGQGTCEDVVRLLLGGSRRRLNGV